MEFVDRKDAGKRLANRLAKFKGTDAVVLALPRGGIVPAAEVAKALRIPLGLVLVRKIGHPAYAEYAIGAVAGGEVPLYNESIAAEIDSDWLRRAETSARQLSRRRQQFYYEDDFKPPSVPGRTAIIIDDGIATGLTMEAAVRAISRQQPERTIVAVPVAPSDSIGRLQKLADEVIVLDDPSQFLGAVGAHYQQFKQINDEEVKALLREVQHAIHQTASSNH
jgi:predicted phosphoribosyltransferase